MRERAWRPITLGVLALLAVAAVLSTTLDPERSSALAEGWSTATVNGAEGGVMTDVTSVTDGFLAVGHGQQDGRQVPAMWRSTSGHDWQRVQHPAFEDLAAGGDQAVMTAISTDQKLIVVAGYEAGSSEDGPVAFWVSDDQGTNWERVRHDDEVFLAGRVNDVTVSEDGSWIAVGARSVDDGTRASVWRSPDGRVWEMVAPTATDAVDDQAMHVVAAGGDGLVAMGRDGSGRQRVDPVWTSSDGVTWRRAPLPDGTPDPAAEVRDIIPWRQEGMVVALDGGSEGSPVQVISRLDAKLDDVTSWRTATVAEDDARATGLVDSGDGHIFLVGTSTGAGGPTLAAWTSQDAQTWEPVETSGLDAPGVTPSAIATNGKNTVIVGSGDGAAVVYVHGQRP